MRAGLAAAVGLGLGILPWGGLVAAGLSALLSSGSGSAIALAIAGGCYLLWMAWRAWPWPDSQDDVTAATVAEATPGGGAVANPSPTSGTSRGLSRPLRDGIVVNVTNATLVPFLGAVLPPFIVVPGPSPAGQAFLLVVVLAVVSTVVNAGWSIGGATAGRRLRRGSGHLAAKLAAVLYTGLAAFVIAHAFLSRG